LCAKEQERYQLRASPPAYRISYSLKPTLPVPPLIQAAPNLNLILLSMTRRPFHVLQELFRRLSLRVISVADGGGCIYVLFEGMTAGRDWIVKIGMTIDFYRRMTEHDRVCPNPVWVPINAVPVNFRRRQGTWIFFRSFSSFFFPVLPLSDVEALFHLYAESLCIDRPRTPCQFCTFFKFF
jgi:hypothetical protein